MDWSQQTLQAMHHCVCCPRRCGADRANGERGLCGAKLDVAVARAMPHYFEEPCISGTRGSGTIFFSGCSLHCCFCQNEEISRSDSYGQLLSADDLAETILQLTARGVHNISFVTPTHYTYQIADVLRALRPSLPVVWNSGGYECVETISMLEGLVDVWLPDLKFADNEVGARCTTAADYASHAFPAVAKMAELAPINEFNADGIMTKGVLVRHLCLPGQTSQSKKILDWVAAELGTNTAVSLMRQYVPTGKALTMPPLDRPLRAREYERVFDYMMNLGLVNGFTQDAEAAEEGYVPQFSGEGVVTATQEEQML